MRHDLLGADCIILNSEEKAKRVTDKPVYLVTDAERVAYQVGDMLPDVTTSGITIVADWLFKEVRREEIDCFQVYDDYPIAVLFQIEDLGYCKKGEGGKFVESHDLSRMIRIEEYRLRGYNAP